MLCPLAVEHYLGLGENLSQPAQAPGVVEVDVGGDDVFWLSNPQFRGGFLDVGDEQGGARLDYGAVAVFNEVNGKDGVNTGNPAFQAVGLPGDGFKSNGYFFTSRKLELILLKIPLEGKFFIKVPSSPFPLARNSSRIGLK